MTTTMIDITDGLRLRRELADAERALGRATFTSDDREGASHDELVRQARIGRAVPRRSAQRRAAQARYAVWCRRYAAERGYSVLAVRVSTPIPAAAADLAYRAAVLLRTPDGLQTAPLSSLAAAAHQDDTCYGWAPSRRPSMDGLPQLYAGLLAETLARMPLRARVGADDSLVGEPPAVAPAEPTWEMRQHGFA